MASIRKLSSTSTINEHLLDQACSFNEVIKVISPRWKMQILFSIFEGNDRFSLILKEHASLSKNILAQRLRELENEGFVVKRSNLTVKPIAINYELTPKANSLLDMVPTFCLWGDQYLNRTDINS